MLLATYLQSTDGEPLCTKVLATLFNPSNITIGAASNVTFDLYFQDVVIGTAVIIGLILHPGVNVIPTAVRYAPTADNAAIGQILLENYVQGIISDTRIIGTPNTTTIKSLQLALGSIQLATTIPALHQNLIAKAEISFGRDIATSHVATATFELENPFSASVNLLSVNANATYGGLLLGQINVSLRFTISDQSDPILTSLFLYRSSRLIPLFTLQVILRRARPSYRSLLMLYR